MKKYLSPKNEKEFLGTGQYSAIVGIDEVGRGCLAGPVMVGGYLYTLENVTFRGVHDSKMLTAEQRNKLYKKLHKHNYIVKSGTVEEIDTLGIAKVIEKLIAEIINYFNNENNSLPYLYLIDGQFSRNFGINTRKIIRADSTYYSVAAASILAKVERDKFMTDLSSIYPNYFFFKNKGYATKFHRGVLKEIGPSEIHRKSFQPVRTLFDEETFGTVK